MLPKLEVLIPDPDTSGFRLDFSALDTVRFNDAPAGELILGSSHLDAGRLAPYLPPPTWFDITGYGTEINTRAGYRANELNLTPDVGTLTAELKNAPDLSSIGVGHNTPVRLRIPTPAGTYALTWIGRVTNVNDTWTRGARGEADTLRTTVEAEDAVAVLASIPRYGAQTPQRLDDRLKTLATSIRSAVANVTIPPTGDQTRIAATVHESNVLDYLAMTAATARRALHVTYTAQRSTIGLRIDIAPDPRNVQAPTVTFSDHNEPSYFSATRETGTSDIVSAVEITTHLRTSDGTAQDETKTISDPTLVQTFGTRTERLEVMAEVADLDQIGKWALTPSILARATITRIDIRGQDSTIAGAPLTPGDPIDIIRLGSRYPVVVAGVSHTITVDTNEPWYSHRTQIETRRRFPNGY